MEETFISHQPYWGSMGKPKPPPGQRFVEEWQIYSALGVPKIDLASWTLTMGGLTERILVLSYEELSSMPQTKILDDFHCVTGWSLRSLEFEGVSMRHLAELAGVRPEAKWVMFVCADGYTAPVPIEDALHEKSLVVLKMNGKPLTVEQGFPARPFIPHLYAWKSAKWLVSIEFMKSYVDGYWEARGYHERGNVYLEERYKSKST